MNLKGVTTIDKMVLQADIPVRRTIHSPYPLPRIFQRLLSDFPAGGQGPSLLESRRVRIEMSSQE